MLFLLDTLNLIKFLFKFYQIFNFVFLNVWLSSMLILDKTDVSDWDQILALRNLALAVILSLHLN